MVEWPKEALDAIGAVIDEATKEAALIDFDTMNKYTFELESTGYTIRYVLPGANKDDISVEIQKDELLNVNVKRSEEFKGFKDALWIPDNVSKEKITASYKNGLLILKLPTLPEGWDSKHIVIE